MLLARVDSQVEQVDSQVREIISHSMIIRSTPFDGIGGVLEIDDPLAMSNNPQPH